MARNGSPAALREIDSLFEAGSVAGLTDRQLLERFNAKRDTAGAAAFEALVRRHGPMVLSLCRRLLGDSHHAEDVFQAVFMVLARKAPSIRNPDLLSGWLHGVARRAARNASRRLSSRPNPSETGNVTNTPSRIDSTAAIDTSLRSAEEAASAREEARALHEEIDALPRSFRLPVLLCYFEGLTLDEAAVRLEWPAGTVRSRLARARDKLRRRLAGRGFASSAVLVAELDSRMPKAWIAPPLMETTARAALDFAAIPKAGAVGSALAGTLAQEVITSMLIHKLGAAAIGFMLVGGLVTGAGFLGHSLANHDEPTAATDDPRQRPIAKTAKVDPRPGPGRMVVVGRVLDPAGKPVSGAVVDVAGRSREAWAATDPDASRHIAHLGQATSDPDGRFRLETRRTTADQFFELYALAAAPHFGLGWVLLNADAEQPAADIRLRPEQPVHGVLVDMHGEPARGVELRVVSLSIKNEFGGFDGVGLSENPPTTIRSWPRPIKTDDRGRFSLPGIGPGIVARLDVQDPRYARQYFAPESRKGNQGPAPTFALEPAKTITGRVLAADTGKPIPNSVIGASVRFTLTLSAFRADADGRFTINPSPGNSISLRAVPPVGFPYLSPVVDFEWPKGAVSKNIDLKAPRGVLIQGKIHEEGTGRPLARASVQYLALGGSREILSGWQAIVASDSDGTYRIAVPPGKGHLLVFGPTSDYVLKEIGENELTLGKPGGIRRYAHEIVTYDASAGERPIERNLTLRPGKTVTGRIVGPNGETVDDALIITTLHIEHFQTAWRGDLPMHARDGQFTLRGVDFARRERISFLDPNHEWGTTIESSMAWADDPPTVRLQPCGAVKARFVGPDGKAAAKHYPQVELVGRAGPSAHAYPDMRGTALAADEIVLSRLDRQHYANFPATDAEGRIVLRYLIPGAIYRVYDTTNQKRGNQLRKEFSIKAGETIDLGEIVIDQPS
jgi:RNA polymerase sigma factor (sigma-70 family)